MPNITELDLDALQAICDAATIPPWDDAGENGILQTTHVTRDVWYIPRNLEDITFIATARTAMPLMIAKLKAVDAWIKEQKKDQFEMAYSPERMGAVEDIRQILEDKP